MGDERGEVAGGEVGLAYLAACFERGVVVSAVWQQAGVSVQFGHHLAVPCLYFSGLPLGVLPADGVSEHRGGRGAEFAGDGGPVEGVLVVLPGLADRGYV